MFWSTMAIEERELDKKLKTPETLDLKSILEDPHCLQEIRNSHEPLLNFLKRDDIFKEMMAAILLPQVVENAHKSQNLKDKYRFTHQCCDAVCIGAREFYPKFEDQPELVDMFTNFFSNNVVNPLIVSFYSRLVINFLTAEPDKFLNLLENSNFLANCFSALDNCSLFELICTISNCLPDSEFRQRVKLWYVNKGFAGHLLENLHPSQPSATHENTAALWVEFIKALRDYQYSMEQCSDSLLESIQSEQIVLDLLKLMFPGIDSENKENEHLLDEIEPSVISNGILVLNALLETNQVRNSPSSLLFQEAQQKSNDPMDPIQQQCSFNTTEGSLSSTGPQFMMDPKRIVESHCADRASAIIRIAIDSLDRSAEDFVGDQLCGCMQMLINLTNTNFLPTHFELAQAFAASSDPLRQLFDSVKLNPNRSIFNAQLLTLVLHILYSSTGTQKPLIEFLFKDLNILALIRQALPEEGQLLTNTSHEMYSNERLTNIARRSFFLQLANRILQSQQSPLSPNAEYIERLIKESPDNDAWVEFCANSVQSFVDQNRSEKVISMSTTNRSSNAIEIDELPEDNLLPLPNLSVDTQNLFGEFHDLKLDPMFPSTTIHCGTSSYSPKGFSTSFTTMAGLNTSTTNAFAMPREEMHPNLSDLLDDEDAIWKEVGKESGEGGGTEVEEKQMTEKGTNEEKEEGGKAEEEEDDDIQTQPQSQPSDSQNITE